MHTPFSSFLIRLLETHKELMIQGSEEPTKCSSQSDPTDMHPFHSPLVLAPAYLLLSNTHRDTPPINSLYLPCTLHQHEPARSCWVRERLTTSLVLLSICSPLSIQVSPVVILNGAKSHV